MALLGSTFVGLAIALFVVQTPPEPSLQEQLLPDQVRAATAAVGVVGTGQPIATAATLVRAQDISAWLVETASPTTKPAADGGVPVLDPEILEGVKHKQPLADINIHPEEVRAYNYVLATASKASAEALLKHARRDLSYRYIYEDYEELQGQLILVEGTLVRLWRHEPDRRMKKDGIADHYEGWVVDKKPSAEPLTYCVIFTELPPGIEVGDSVSHPVRFAGYYFKRYRVRNAQQKPFDAPLLVGRTIHLSAVPRGVDTGEAKQTFVLGFFAVVGSTGAAILGLSWWYVRKDREVQRRLSQARPVEFHEDEDTSSTNGHLRG